MATTIRLPGKGISVTDLMRRLAKPLPIALAIGAIIIAIYGFLGVGIFQQQREHEALQSQVASQEQVLSKRASQQEPPAKLEERRGAAEARLTAAFGLFPREEDGIFVVRDAIAIAEGSGLKLVSAEAQARRMAKLGKNNYPVLGFKLKADGSSQQCLDYIGKLEQGLLSALVVDQASMNKTEDGYTLEVEFSVYCRPTLAPAASPKGPATPGQRP